MADKLSLPKGKFARELVAAPVDPTMKAAEATTGKLYRVPVDKLKVIPGFNLRVETPDYIAHRDEIRASIAANGFNPKKPLSGYVATEDGENVIYITDGHTRLAAVNDYNSDPDTAEADEIATLPVIVSSKETSKVDLLVELHTANTGRKLTPFEQGVLAKRLIGEGLKKTEIATRLGMTARYVDDVLLLADADPKVKQHVAAGDVSSTMAIQLLRKDPDAAAEKIETAVKKAAKTGKKATKKHTEAAKTEKVKVSFNYTKGQDMKEIVKAAAAAIREAIPAEEVTDGDELVKQAAVKGFVSITVEVPAAKKAKAEKADEKPAKKAKAEKADEKPAKEAKAEKADEKADEKPAKKAKAEKPAKKPAKKAKAEKADDLGIPGAAAVVEEDDEPAILPPKVASDDIQDDDEVDI